ncbi:hypothetical protein D3C79_645030 [compost metagenome]
MGQQQIDHGDTRPLLGSADTLVEGVEQLATVDHHLRRTQARQPAPPIAAVCRAVQQLKAVQGVQVPRCSSRMFRAAHRYQPLVKQLEAVDLGGKTPVSQQNRGLERFAVEIDVIDIHPHAGQLHTAV